MVSLGVSKIGVDKRTPSKGVRTFALAAPADFAARWTPSVAITRTVGALVVYAATLTGAPAVPAKGSPNTTYYYVSPAVGSDTGYDGSSPTVVGGGVGPFKTMGKVRALAAAGAAGQNIVGVYTLTGDYIARNTEGANNVVAVANEYHVNATPQYRYISAKANNINTTWSVYSGTPGVPGVIYQGTRSAAIVGIVDTAIKTMPWRQFSGGSGYTVGDVLTLSNGAQITVTGVRNGEAVSSLAGATGAVANWTINKRATIMVASDGTGNVSTTGGTGTGATWGARNPNAPIVDDVPTKVASVGAMVAGTFCDNATSVFYAPMDGRSLNLTANAETAIILCVTGNNGRGSVTNNQITYFGDGFSFAGGTANWADNPGNVTGVTGKQMYFGRVSFTGATAGNGLSAQSDVTVYAKNAYCYYSWADGFNAHNETAYSSGGIYAANPSKMILVDCGGMGCGMTGSTNTSDQTLTAHETSMVVAVNFESCGSDDQPVAIVGNAYLWWAGGYAGPSNRTDVGSKQNVAALSQANSSTDIATVWVDGVVIPFNLNNRVVAEGTGRRILVRNISGTVTNDNNDPLASGGTVAAY